MSDIYLILRSRLEEVAADWVHIGPDTMRKAREAKGLSMEAAARDLHVSTKTYDRNEKDGRWRKHDLENLARVIGLVIEQPALGPTVKLDESSAQEAELLEVRRLIVEALERVEDGLAQVH